MSPLLKSPVVIVLAAGRGERFLASGGRTHKLQTWLRDKPVLDWTLEAARASGLKVHVELSPHPGMGDSIAAAVLATADASGWLILPGDLPLVKPKSLLAVAAALAHHCVVQPTINGHKGHPVGFDASCKAELLALQGDQGAHRIVQARGARGQVMQLSLQDKGCIMDIDTYDDLRRAEQWLDAES